MKRDNIIAGALVGGVLLAVMIFGWIGPLASRDEPAPTTTTHAPAPALLTPATSPPVTEPAYDEPKPSDFKLTVKILRKANFGSAGSNIDYRINATWTGTYDPSKTYEITYEVRGGEDGPAINTFTVTGDEYERERKESASTASTNDKLSVRVLSVEEV